MGSTLSWSCLLFVVLGMELRENLASVYKARSLAFATAFFFYHERNDSAASTATAALPHSGFEWFIPKSFHEFSQTKVASHDFRFRSLYMLNIQKSSNCCVQKYDLPEIISRIFPSNNRVTWFPFPVIVYASYSKIVKLLCATIWYVNLTNFSVLIFGGFFDVWPKCVPDAY